MIIDIRYKEETGKAPEQIQGVRMTSNYPHDEPECPRIAVVHFYTKPSRWIYLNEVYCMTITND